jgi:hypothetical protein
LIDGLVHDADYAETWRHFVVVDPAGSKHTLLRLAAQVFTRFRSEYGNRFPVNHPPLGFTVLRQLARVYRPDEPADHNADVRWLEEQVRFAIPESLPLVLNLYDEWASTGSGILRREDRGHIRGVIYDETRRVFQTGADLLRVTHPIEHYDLYQLVFPPHDEQEGISPRRSPEDWAWLGPILIEALALDPARFAPKIGSLIAAYVPRYRNEMTAQTQSERLHGIFGTQAEEVVRLLALERDRLSGQEREFLEQVVRTAQDCLATRSEAR